jgi:hypothetical protein
VALRTVLKAARGEPDPRAPGYVSQRALAKHIDRSQSYLALVESLQRRCDVLEFIDIGDSLYDDRTQLFRDLIRLSPRRFYPINRPSRPVVRRGRITKERRSKR